MNIVKIYFLITCFIFSHYSVFSVDDPANYTATPVSVTEINLTWALNLSSDSVIIAFDTLNSFGIPADGTPYLISEILTGGGTFIYKGNGVSFNHTGLLPDKTYYYKIWSFSAGNIYSAGVVDSAKTYCITPPTYLEEDFENGGNIPDCWTQENVTGTLNWIFHDGNPYCPGLYSPNRNPYHAFEGNFCAFFGSNSSLNNGNTTKLVLPPIDFSTTSGTATLTFWAYNQTEQLKIYYKTSYNAPWVLIATVGACNNWKHYIYELPNPGSDYYIAFEGKKSNQIGNGICIDKITACRGNCCTLPTVSNISSGSWTCFDWPLPLSVIYTPGTQYIWTVYDPLCGIYSNFDMDNSISAYFCYAAGWGEVCVTPYDTCGYGATKCKSVYVDSGCLLQGTISGATNPCVGTIQTYTLSYPYPGCDGLYCNYNWSFPSGWTIVGGDGLSSVTVTVGLTNGLIEVTPMCGQYMISCEGTHSSKNVSPITVPIQPSNITGSTSPCQNTTQTYSVTNVSGVTYTWSVPSGWTIVSGQNTNSVTVTVGSNSGNISVTPSNTCGTGTARDIAVTPNLLPLSPGVITGSISPCYGTSQIYWVIEVGGINYNWTFPSGWTQTGGTTTDSVTFTVGLNSGNITVTPSNGCGNGPSETLAITTFNTPAQPVFNASEFYPCYNTSQIYSVVNETGVTYNWEIPADWIQTGGGTTNEITVTTGALPDTITVIPSNVCGNGLPQTIPVVPVLSIPQIISIAGDTLTCVGNIQNYYVAGEPGVFYSWQFPLGWSQTGGGQSDSVSAITATGNGYVLVTPTNNCGTGVSDSIFISTITVPDQTGSITGDTLPCAGSSQTYFIPGIPDVSYNWSYPADWVVTGGNNSDTIEFIVGSSSGVVMVTPSNICGNGLSQTISVVSVSSIFQNNTIIGDTLVCAGVSQNYSVDGEIGVTYTWQFPSGWTQTGGGQSDSVSAITATGNGYVLVTPSNNCGVGVSDSIFISTITAPDYPGSINGDTMTCAGISQNYSVIGETGVIYTWQFPFGWTQTGGGQSDSVSAITATGNGYVLVTPTNNCGVGISDSVFVSTITIPDQPGSINGDSLPCAGSGQTYIISGIPDVSYSWSYPADWVVTGGNNSDTIEFIMGSSSGILTVTPSNICGNGVPRELTVVPAPVVTPDVSINIQPGENVCDGIPVTLTAVPDNEGVNPVYSWYLNDSLAGNTLSFDILVPDSGAYVYFILQADVLCATVNPAVSDTIVINVHTIPSPPIITINTDTLKSSYPNGNQWYFNNQPLSVTVNNECPIIGDGQYYVVYTDQYGCSSISEIVLITGTINNEVTMFRIYPNPSDGDFILECNLLCADAMVSVTDITGRLLFEEKLNKSVNRVIIPAEKWSPQLLLCRLFIGGNQVMIQRLVKTED